MIRKQLDCCSSMSRNTSRLLPVTGSLAANSLGLVGIKRSSLSAETCPVRSAGNLHSEAGQLGFRV